MKIPAVVRDPVPAEDDSILRALVLDLTLYLKEFSEDNLRAVVDWYERVSPDGHINQYMIEELVTWDDVRRPLLLTRSGRDAAAAGQRLPFLAAVRRRIAEGRRFYVQLWDGASTDMWSLVVRSTHYSDLGLRPFVRVIAPVDSLDQFAEFPGELADMLDFHSGHAGLTFGYNPVWLDWAFDDIYARAKRFWGVDVEHLNGTLRSIKPGIKGISWITLLGRDLLTEELLAAVSSVNGTAVEQRAGGAVIRIGDEPDVLDQNRPGPAIDPYYEVARVLEPLYVEEHDEFPGVFEDNEDTMSWIRRFIDPDDWR